MISFSLLCTHIFKHIKLHIPFIRTTMPVLIGPVLLQNLLHRKGLRNFSGPAGVPIWIPSSTVGTVLDITSTNEMRSSHSMILQVHLLMSGTIWSPHFLWKLVQDMPCRVCELQQHREGYIRYWHQFLKWRWAGQHSLLVSNLSKKSIETFLFVTKYFLNKNVEFCKFQLKLLFFCKSYSLVWHCTCILILPFLCKIVWNLALELSINIDVSECNEILCWKQKNVPN